jgi:hypothetical protein
MAGFRIALERKGSRKYVKVSCPVRYGVYTEIEYEDFLFQYNRNGEIKYIVGRGPGWTHPAEWLKRTLGNNWVYYSTGNYYTGVVDLFGEYYLPCPDYPTNSLFKENPFDRKIVAEALQHWEDFNSFINGRFSRSKRAPKNNAEELFLSQAADNCSDLLQQKAAHLKRILKARIDVLPPDCRHADYDVLPLIIADGCLYNCSFCDIKSGRDLSCRTRDEIMEQLYGLKELLGPDLRNYNSVYLGLHDALAADPTDIVFAAEQAYEILEISKSYMQEPRLFLFASAESFLHQTNGFWHKLNRLPFYNYINLGLESFDEETLHYIKKPVAPEIMKEGFTKMLAVNRTYENIEVTANFLIGDDLPAGQYSSVVRYINEAAGGLTAKGCIYISPLKGSSNSRYLLKQFRDIKHRNRMETYLYLIQRL